MGKRFIQLGKLVGQETITVTQAAMEKKMRKYLIEKGVSIKQLSEESYGKLKTTANIFREEVRSNPKEMAVKMFVAALGFIAAPGGIDADGGIPDLDLIGEIGKHRSIFTHSIIAGVIAETFIFSTLCLIWTVYKNLPESHDTFWDDFKEQSQNIALALSAGISAGIAYHLAVDGTLDGGGTYKDLPIELSMGGHQALILANSAAEAMDVNKKE